MECKNCGSNLDSQICPYCGTKNDEYEILNTVKEIKQKVDIIGKTKVQNKPKSKKSFVIAVSVFFVFVFLSIVGNLMDMYQGKYTSPTGTYTKNYDDFMDVSGEEIKSLRDFILATKDYGHFESISGKNVSEVKGLDITNAVVAKTGENYSCYTQKWNGSKGVEGYVYSTFDQDYTISLKLYENYKQVDAQSVKGRELTKFNLSGTDGMKGLFIELNPLDNYSKLDKGKIYLINTKFLK